MYNNGPVIEMPSLELQGGRVIQFIPVSKKHIATIGVRVKK